VAEQCDKFGAMIEAIRQSAVDPNDVTVGAFAEAVQKIQAELKLIEGQIERLACSVSGALDDDGDGEAGSDDTTPPTRSTDIVDQSAANKP
jgi:hypothetical protein